MSDIKNPELLYAKALLFLLSGVLALAAWCFGISCGIGGRAGSDPQQRYSRSFTTIEPSV